MATNKKTTKAKAAAKPAPAAKPAAKPATPARFAAGPWSDPKATPRERIDAARRTGNRELLRQVRAEVA